MTSMSMNERLLHLERQYVRLDGHRADAGTPDPCLAEAIDAVVAQMAEAGHGGMAGTRARLRVLERELDQPVPAPSCVRLVSAARADLAAAPPKDDGDADLVAASRTFALHHQLAAGAEDDREADRHLDAYDRIGREMARTPARTMAGVALKLFVDLILEHGCQPGRPFGIYKPDGAPYGDPLAWSAIADLHRLTRHLLPEEFRLDEGAVQDSLVAGRFVGAAGPGDEHPTGRPSGSRPIMITVQAKD